MNAVIYLLDTNVLIHDPFALHYFAAAQVIIPFYVLEELDFFKAEAAERGKSSRMVARELDLLRAGHADFRQGIALEKGGLLRILKLDQEKLDGKFWDRGLYYDQLILSLALERQRLGERIVVVSKDINLRIRADVLGLTAIDYDPAQSNQNHFLYEKTAKIELTRDEWTLWLSQGFLALSPEMKGNIPFNHGVCLSVLGEKEMGENEGLDSQDFQHWGRVSSDGQRLLALGSNQQSYWGLKARNPMQQLALDVLCDPQISLVSLIGKAGTGKTLLALAAGLLQVTEKNLYDKVLSARAIFALGKDIGFLPGTLDEKMAPWIKPVLDNLDFLIYQKQQAQGQNRFLQYSKKSSAQDLIDTGLIEVEPITYLRGRSLPKQFMMIDEAQNLTHHEIKTILTRAGEGTKIVLLGDPDQIDHPYLDNVQNGLWYATQKFKGQAIASTVFLTKGERSGLAELAADLL